MFLLHACMILQRVIFAETKVNNKNRKYVNHWSVAQTGSNDEKKLKLEVENLVGLSLKIMIIFTIHSTPTYVT